MKRTVGAGHLIVLLTAASLASLIAALAIGAHPFAEASAGISAAGRLCARLLTAGRTSALLATSLAAAALAVHLLAAALALGRGWRKREHLRLLLSALPQVPPGDGLSRALERAGLAERVVLVQSPEPFAFTMGLLKARVYLSTEAVRRLSGEELEAVLWHERRHLEARDPLKLHLLSAVHGAFGYLPALPYLSELFLRRREFEADDEALRRAGSVKALLGALVKLGRPAPPAPAVGYGGFAAERIARLLAGPEGPAGRGWARALTLALSSLALLAVLPALSLLLTEAGHLIPSCLG